MIASLYIRTAARLAAERVESSSGLTGLWPRKLKP